MIAGQRRIEEASRMLQEVPGHQTRLPGTRPGQGGGSGERDACRPHAWNHIAVQAKTALVVIREEMHANHPAA